MFRTSDRGSADELRAFLALAKSGSFVAAGRALSRHPSVITKRVRELEGRLGIRLVERTTRQVRLTDVGSRLAERLDLAADMVDEAQVEAMSAVHEVSGNLRLAFPATMGRLWLASLVPAFLERFPKLKVAVDYSDDFVDLLQDGYDAAIRIGQLRDSRLMARKLADHRRVLAASQSYLERHGVPSQPSDLVRHNCLEFTGLASFPVWHLSDGKRVDRVEAGGTLRGNDTTALLEAARAGVGILGAGEWLVSRDFEAGTLVPVLPDWSFDVEAGIYLVRPSARFAPARTEAFLDWAAEIFREGPPWSTSR